MYLPFNPSTNLPKALNKASLLIFLGSPIITAFPPKLKIQSYVNKELRQKGNTGDMIFDISYIIWDLTTGITLYPGDIILTGTPAGVGAGFNPPKYLKPGDKVDCLIEEIGTLSNTIA
jgi:2-keto-4-pentenoate hydratase/2-oxohepta-3-ene-1,7-dioic acid hydratase in catechol pathway